MGNLLHNCVKVHKPIELLFGVVSEVSGGMGVSDGGPHASREGAVSGFFAPWV